MYKTLFTAAYRCLPVVILIVGISKGVGKSKSFSSFSYTLAVQNEVNEIVKLISLDSVSGQRPPTVEEFPNYIRTNLKQKAGITREPTQDMWGTPYLLVVEGDVVRVISFGPDKLQGTADDIVAEARLQPSM